MFVTLTPVLHTTYHGHNIEQSEKYSSFKAARPHGTILFWFGEWPERRMLVITSLLQDELMRQLVFFLSKLGTYRFVLRIKRFYWLKRSVICYVRVARLRLHRSAT
jgi:hypothetical protein